MDILLLASSLYIAHLVRFDFNIPSEHLQLFYKILPLVLITKLIIFFYFDLYRGMWRYTSVTDLFNIIKASIISTLLIVSVILFSPRRFLGFPRSVFIIDWCLTILFISGVRLYVRFFYEYQTVEESNRNTIISLLRRLGRRGTGSTNLLIIGAGDCGEKILREIRDNARLQYNVVGFLDDNPAKIGMKIHGVSVLSYVSDIKVAAKKVSADEALIAIPSANSKEIRKIV
jgi:FlaA1/EpsC-like NDP-sugar epimerase